MASGMASVKAIQAMMVDGGRSIKKVENMINKKIFSRSVKKAKSRNKKEKKKRKTRNKKEKKQIKTRNKKEKTRNKKTI